MAAIEERQQKIAEGLRGRGPQQEGPRAGRGKGQRGAARSARQGDRDHRRRRRRARAQIIDLAKEEAIEEGNRQKAAAAAEIVSSGNRAREDLRKQVSVLAVAGAEKLILREIDGNAHKALLDELAAQI